MITVVHVDLERAIVDEGGDRVNECVVGYLSTEDRKVERRKSGGIRGRKMVPVARNTPDVHKGRKIKLRQNLGQDVVGQPPLDVDTDIGARLADERG